MNQRIVIGIAGEMASGKDTVKEYLKKKYQAEEYRMSDILRYILNRLHIPIERENFTKLSLALRNSFGEDVLIKTVFADISGNEEGILVVDGVRRLAEFEYLQKVPGFKFIYLMAPLEVRYKRLKQRDEKDGDKLKTITEFKKDHQLETEQTILPLKEKADFVVSNDGTLDELYQKIDEIMKKISQ